MLMLIIGWFYVLIDPTSLAQSHTCKWRDGYVATEICRNWTLPDNTTQYRKYTCQPNITDSVIADRLYDGAGCVGEILEEQDFDATGNMCQGGDAVCQYAFIEECVGTHNRSSWTIKTEPIIMGKCIDTGAVGPEGPFQLKTARKYRCDGSVLYVETFSSQGDGMYLRLQPALLILL